MSDDKPSASAAPTPETDELVKKFEACDYLFVNHAKRLERERDEARRGFERMSDTCFAAIRRAETAEEELAAAKEQIELLRNDAIHKVMAASDDQINALSRMEGHNPDDVAKLGRKALEVATLTVQLAAERKRADVLQADMDKIREAYEAMKNG